jgi:hypothetical protein
MYHSITFGAKNTWTDWHLVPLTRPVFNPPPVKTKYVEIPGVSGELDVSTLLAGRPIFGNRTGSFEFVVYSDTYSWLDAYLAIETYLHGKEKQAILEDDDIWYYEGIFVLNQVSSEKSFAKIVINYDVKPYKKRINTAWLWDPFDFETGYVPGSDGTFIVNGTDSILVQITGDPQIIIPTFTTSAAMSVKFDGHEYQLPLGLSRVHDIAITEGLNSLLFSGVGNVTIGYRGGSL